MRFPCCFFLLATPLFAFGAANPTASCLIDQRPAALVALEDGRLIVEVEGRRMAAPANADWSVPFAELVAANCVAWAPYYQLGHADAESAALAPDKPFRARVVVPPAAPAPVRGGEVEIPVLLEWPGAQTPIAAVAALWLVDGQPAHVQMRAWPAEPHFSFQFQLSATEAAGRPVLLLWQQGAFLPAAPLFTDPSTQQAALAILRDDTAGLGAALGAGADPRVRTRGDLTLAGLAATTGSVAALETLHQHDRRLLTSEPKNQPTALQHAAAKNRASTLRWLLGAPGRADTGTVPAGAALEAAASAGHLESIRVLIDGTKALRDREVAHRVLWSALRHGHAVVAEELLAAGAKLNPVGRFGGSMLHGTLRDGHEASARILLRLKADPNTLTGELTTLHIAARHSSAALLEELLAAGAKTDVSTSSGYTPLMAAAEGANTPAALALLARPHEVNGRTREGVTALHIAARHNAGELIEALLKHGAERDGRTERGLTALDLALLTGSGTAARILAGAGARIDLAGPRAEAMLECAVRHDIPEPVAAALATGWPAQSTFGAVWPALRVAQIFGSTACEKLLRDAGATSSPDDPVPLAMGTELDAPTRVTTAVMPEDPRDAQEEFPATQVRVELLVTPEGRALFPRVHDAADPRLGPAVFEAIKHWQFQPPRRQGQPVALRVIVPLVFPASSDRTFEIGALQQRPKPIKRSNPLYPRDAMSQRINGMVVIGFIVNTEGMPIGLHVVESSHKAFEAPALQCMREWRFEPGRMDGRAVNTRMQQPIVFQITN